MRILNYFLQNLLNFKVTSKKKLIFEYYKFVSEIHHGFHYHFSFFLVLQIQIKLYLFKIAGDL